MKSHICYLTNQSVLLQTGALVINCPCFASHYEKHITKRGPGAFEEFPWWTLQVPIFIFSRNITMFPLNHQCKLLPVNPSSLSIYLRPKVKMQASKWCKMTVFFFWGQAAEFLFMETGGRGLGKISWLISACAHPQGRFPWVEEKRQEVELRALESWHSTCVPLAIDLFTFSCLWFHQL